MLARVPLRTQLLVLLLATVTLAVLATSLAATAALRSYLVDRIDRQLVGALQTPPEGRPGPGDPRGRGRDVAVVRLEYDEAGRLRPPSVERLSRLGGPEVADPSSLPAVPTDVPGQDGSRSWRVLAGPDPRGGTVVVAVSLEGVQDTAARLLLINAAVGLAALVAAGALGWWAVGRSLRPLATVESTAQEIAAGDLSVRVPAGDLRTEVGSLAASFNAMVDRFETAYSAQQDSEAQARASEARMRRFVGDASHELRTPLTSIRGFAELFRQGAAQDPQQLAQVMRRIEDAAQRMGLLVEDLLLLARLDQSRPLRREPVDLLAVAADVVQAAAATYGTSHGLQLHPPEDGPPPVVLGDEARLHQVASNLVTNALVHTPAGTRVDVAVTVQDDAVVLAVRDDGPGMTPDVAERVFERFYRADDARTRAGAAGSGLGLSIVQALVAAHDGTVEVNTAPGRGTLFTVRLPVG